MTLAGSSHKFCSWFAKIKLSRIILILLFILVMAPLFAHYFLSEVERNSSSDSHKTKLKLENLDDFTSQYKLVDLKKRINDMIRIKGSVSQELRDLEAKRLDMTLEMNSYVSKLDQIKQDIVQHQDKLDKLKISINQAQLAHIESLRQNSPQLFPPLQLRAKSIPVRHNSVPGRACSSLGECVDYTRCSITSGFPVYVYKPLEQWMLSTFMRTTLWQAFKYNPHFTSNPTEACMFVVLIGESDSLTKNVEDLHSLPYWGDSGRNHILINLSRNNLMSTLPLLNPSSHTGHALIAQTVWTDSSFRPKVDLVIPPGIGLPGGDIWQDCPYLLPARRKYLLSYQGSGRRRRHRRNVLPRDEYEEATRPVKSMNENSEGFFEAASITKYLTRSTTDLFHFDWNCSSSSDVCYSDTKRAEVLRHSTFVLMFAEHLTLWSSGQSEPGHNETKDSQYRHNDEEEEVHRDSYVSTLGIQIRLYEALKYGAVPVIVGDSVVLPYEEVIDWNKASLRLPLARIPELHLLVRSVSDEDIVSFRHQGRQIFTRYMATLQSQIDTLLSIVRHRLGIPPLPAVQTKSSSVFREGFSPLKMDPVIAEAEPEENLGPLEPPYPSPSFRRNYTLFLTQGYEMWNVHMSPFHLFPQLPFDPILPSDAKFMGSDYGFRPINKGAGGTGKEFYENLGSNKQREQFTIVILTYEREQVLINSLSRLNNLPYLNKVLVVWNSVQPPRDDLRWPDIGVPVVVIRTNSNDLNNRFKPYDAIETEAVLNMDDDVYLRHDEIMFAFRVWREQRDRIVGFPGRYHAWDQNNQGGWLYNSNYSCELSMVLTGAAFVHTYYLHEYAHVMPQAIRDKVAEEMNCEDIAMNFLVSHLTRKPPVKVTSRWTFRCPGCPVTLSEDESHFTERHKCIQLFSQIYGYNPLLYTQFRVDSVLFKTRIPHDKTKCFKFI